LKLVPKWNVPAQRLTKGPPLTKWWWSPLDSHSLEFFPVFFRRSS
jgi:hypothetical protein